MLSQQRNTALDRDDSRRAANAIPEDRILDAAYELMLAVGMRRMTMADIARHAGVSRATLYRRWANVQAVIGALTTREFAALGPQLALGAGSTVRESVVAGVVSGVRAVRVHPLTRKIVDVDPEFLLPYLLERKGTSTASQLELLEAALRIEDGSVRAGNRHAQARTIWLTALSFVLTAPVLTDRRASLDSLDAELRTMLDRYLAP